MRKRFKKKKHGCGLCKPHKVGWSNRWTAKEAGGLREFEKERHKNSGAWETVADFTKINKNGVDAMEILNKLRD